MNLFQRPGLQLNPQLSILVAVLAVWALFWKGLALWRASKSNQVYWFIALLILNTVGILEIIYLFGFAKDKLNLKEFPRFIQSSFKTSKKK